MSTIRKPKGKKNYEIWFSYEGKQYHRSLGVTDKPTAQKIRHEIDALIIQRKLDPNAIFRNPLQGKTVAGLCDDFTSHLNAGRSGLADTTIRCYKAAASQWKKQHGKVLLSSINRQWVNKMIEDLNESGRARNYIRITLSQRAIIVGHAIKNGYDMINYFHGVLPRHEKRLPRKFSDQEVYKIKEYFNDPKRKQWHRTFFLLLLATGIRKSEALDLLWSKNVFIREHHLKILGKGKKWRTVPLSDTAITILKQHKRILGKDRVFYMVGNPSSPNWVWKQAQERLKIKARVHDFRSNFAWYYFDRSGGNAKKLMAIMGWENWATVKKYLNTETTFIEADRNLVQF